MVICVPLVMVMCAPGDGDMCAPGNGDMYAPGDGDMCASGDGDVCGPDIGIGTLEAVVAELVTSCAHEMRCQVVLSQMSDSNFLGSDKMPKW